MNELYQIIGFEVVDKRDSIAPLLASDHISLLAKTHELAVRSNCQVDFVEYMQKLILFKDKSASNNESERLIAVAMTCDCADKITIQGFQKACAQEKVTNCLAELTSEFMSNCYGFTQDHTYPAARSIIDFLRSVGVEHVIAVDGVELTVVPRTNNKVECPNKGRKRG